MPTFLTRTAHIDDISSMVALSDAKRKAPYKLLLYAAIMTQTRGRF